MRLSLSTKPGLRLGNPERETLGAPPPLFTTKTYKENLKSNQTRESFSGLEAWWGRRNFAPWAASRTVVRVFVCLGAQVPGSQMVSVESGI